MKRSLPLALTFIVALVFMAGKFINTPLLNNASSLINEWSQIVTASLILLGVVGLSVVHIPRVMQRRKDWLSSLIILSTMYGYIIYGLFSGLSDPTFLLVYNNIIARMQMAMFSTLMFYLGSAAFRSFRARSREATLLLLAASIVMIGNVTLGQAISPYIPVVSKWIVNVPVTAGMRAIGIGAALGGIMSALKIWMGIERGYLS